MRVIQDFIGLFFPNYCLSCSTSLVAGEETLCTRCVFTLPKAKFQAKHNSIADKLVGRIPIRYGMAFLSMKKGGTVQKMLHELKYNHHPEIGVKLGKVFGKELSAEGLSREFDLITPVPLHASRLRKRGYNQSAKFAEGLSSSLDIPWDETIMVRRSKTKTQTRKSKMERWENVKDVFKMEKADAVMGKRVLLVDDVITTGATVEACGQHLIAMGCAELSVACIAEAHGL